MPTNKKSVYVIWYTVGTTRDSYNEHFCLPTLSEEEMKSCYRLGGDTWANTICSGKNAYVEIFIEGEISLLLSFQRFLVL